MTIKTYTNPPPSYVPDPNGFGGFKPNFLTVYCDQATVDFVRKVAPVKQMMIHAGHLVEATIGETVDLRAELQRCPPGQGTNIKVLLSDEARRFVEREANKHKIKITRVCRARLQYAIRNNKDLDRGKQLAHEIYDLLRRYGY